MTQQLSTPSKPYMAHSTKTVTRPGELDRLLLGDRQAGPWKRVLQRLRTTLGITPTATGATPHDLFREVDDDMWLWLNTEGYRTNDKLRAILPGLPPERIQEQYTGLKNDATLREGFKCYKVFKAVAEQHLGDLSRGGPLLDFGCGWGRIIRFFLRDLPPEKIWGVDCTPEMIEFCQQSNRWCTFHVTPTLPPTQLAADTFDFIYAFSVFSHLEEKAHLQFLREFHRILRPGGVLAVTTRPREWFEMIGHMRAHKQSSWVLPECFLDLKKTLDDYEHGRFCHEAVGGGGVLASSFYGETAIPKGYVLEHWTKMFKFLDFIDDRERCEQNIIVCRKE